MQVMISRPSGTVRTLVTTKCLYRIVRIVKIRIRSGAKGLGSLLLALGSDGIDISCLCLSFGHSSNGPVVMFRARSVVRIESYLGSENCAILWGRSFAI